MYYSASTADNPKLHCVGVATAPTVLGPYTPHSNPIICPTEQGGAIDAAGFESDGQRYIVYKVVGCSLSRREPVYQMLTRAQDGNALGNGGPCGNTGKWSS